MILVIQYPYYQHLLPRRYNMWEGISGLITLAVMVLKLWIDNKNAQEANLNAQKKEISDAISSGNISSINSVIQQLRS